MTLPEVILPSPPTITDEPESDGVPDKMLNMVGQIVGDILGRPLISATISASVWRPSSCFQIRTPMGLRLKVLPVSGSKRIAQSSNSSRRTISGLATAVFFFHLSLTVN